MKKFSTVYGELNLKRENMRISSESLSVHDESLAIVFRIKTSSKKLYTCLTKDS